MKKAFLNWSSGKDAAFALYLLQLERDFSVEKLITTVNSETERISMHGLRKELLQQQAESLEIPLQLIEIPGNVPMTAYKEIMDREISGLKTENFTHSVFGDIILEDLREYREKQLQKAGFKAHFPLWGRNTAELMENFIAAGFKAIIVTVNARYMDNSFCGRIIDRDFLTELPPNVDPAGENGEFHSFVFDGPNFTSPIGFKKGNLAYNSFLPKGKKDFYAENENTWDTEYWYLDLLPERN